MLEDDFVLKNTYDDNMSITQYIIDEIWYEDGKFYRAKYLIY